MTALKKAEILEMLDKLGSGQTLYFGFPPTFGGGATLVRLNPLFPQKGEKKYQVRIGESAEMAQNAEPIFVTDKPKKVAVWLADRMAFVLEQPSPAPNDDKLPPLKKAS